MEHDCINFDAVTLQDCEELFQMKNIYTVINDGHIVEFRVEEKE